VAGLGSEIDAQNFRTDRAGQRLDLKSVAGHRRRSSSKIVNSAFAGSKLSMGGRAVPTTAIETKPCAAVQSPDRALQDGIHWPMMAAVRSVALAAAARNGAV
jgi:hypothetical protein